MAIFVCLNFHISGGGQRPSTKFDTVVDAPRIHFHLKARRDRANEFAAINGDFRKFKPPYLGWGVNGPQLNFARGLSPQAIFLR